MRLLRSSSALAAILLATSAPGADAGYATGRAGFGAWTVPVPLAVQAQNDLAPGQGVLVLHVRPGSTAAGLGVQVGDIITSLNDHPVDSRQDIRAVVRAAAPGDEASVSVVKDGATSQLDGEFQARLPRPPGGFGGFGGLDPALLAALGAQLPGGMPGPGGWWGGANDGLTPAQRQQAELLAERAEVADARAELAQASEALPRHDGAWVASFAISVGDPAADP